MRKIISLVVMLVAALIIYNNFYGTEEDKARGAEVRKEFKDLAVSVGKLLKSEKNNFSDGKFDGALDKVTGLFKNLGSKANEMGGDYPDKVKELEQQLADLKAKSDQAKSSRIADPAAQKQEMDNEMTDLLNNLAELTKEMQN